MTPKEKAQELINKFIPHTKVFHEVLGWEDYLDSAKECALIAVDEIINGNFGDGYNHQFWECVKNEIEKI